MSSTVPALSLALVIMGVIVASVPDSPPPDAAAARRALFAVFDEQWEHWMRTDPTWASELGDRRYDDRWPERTPQSYDARQAHDVAMLLRLRGIDREALSPEDRINHDLFARRLQDDVDERRFRTHLLAVSHGGGVQSANELSESLRFESARDYENWIARLLGVGTYLDQVTELLREGIRTGMTQPRVIMSRVPAQIDKQVVDAPESSPFYDPFRAMPDAIPVAERDRLRERARAAIRDVVVPAYRRFGEFFRGTYLPACREGVGASALPDGAAFYAMRVRQMTTTELAPQEIHDTGLREVARIRGEMQAVIEQVGFKGSFDDFVGFLRTDPRFYAKTPDELLQVYLATSKRVDPELVKLFGTLPRMPYGVRPIPDETAPDTTTAYYNGPAADGSRAGTYYVNLYRPEVRPLYEIEALSLHEAVPGHHLQIALAMEQGDLPMFRRHGGYTAYVEGWGLYAESLGAELGMYRDPYSRFGQLTYEMWRAVRLVVDTGLHAFGWDRQRAIDYFKANAAKSEHDIVNEIDRYIGWPGQALAYKVGELKIKELRRHATQTLGERFDVRAFHDVVLGSGAVPLDVLERNVRSWVEGVAAAR
jgi:prolyl oligopeptidase